MTPSESISEKSEKLPTETRELVAAIQQLPESYRRQLEPALQKVVESTHRRKRILALVQDALGQLRLDMKYLMFDLESTRKERDEAIQKLNEA